MLKMFHMVDVLRKLTKILQHSQYLLHSTALCALVAIYNCDSYIAVDYLDSNDNVAVHMVIVPLL